MTSGAESVDAAIFPSIVVVTNEAYPAHSLLSAYALAANRQDALPWRVRGATVRRFSFQRTTPQAGRAPD